MKHKHHIIPKHMGGTDDPSNLVELTIEEHAEAHRILYETHGLIEDKVAWLGLSGIVPKAEAMKDLYRLGKMKMDKILYEKYGVINPGQLEHNRQMASERFKRLHSEGKIKGPDWTGKKHREESKRKIGMKNAIQQAGSKNSQFGTMWITNGTRNKKIKSTETIPDGWNKGRAM